MKKILLALLAVPLIALGQTYPSPTFSSLTLQNPLTAANGGTGTTTSTGTGSAVLSNSPMLVTPNLGTPSTVTLTNGTGLPISTGVSGLGTGVAAGLANAVTGSGSPVLATSPTLTTPNLGTPSAATLTNATGLPVSTGLAGAGTGVTTALGTAVTGSGGIVLATSPTIATPTITSPTISNPTLNGTYAGSMTIPSTSLTYTASGTGGVSQTLSSRFAQTAFVDSYGAVGNGTSDDSTPLTNAMAALGASGGIVFLDCTKNYAILSNVTIPANVQVKHCRGGGPWGNPGFDWSSEPLASQPHINLASTASITMASNTSFDGVILLNGTTFPVSTPASFAGTAIKLATGFVSDVRINALIVGFATCVDGTNSGDHMRWDIECDANPATSVGAVIIGNGGDTNRFRIRTYPWGTVGAASPTNTRTGIGTQVLAGPLDDAHMDLFDFGHAVGVDTRANGNVHYDHVWVDNNSTMGMYVYNNNNSYFGSVWAWTTPGILFQSNSLVSFGFIYCNSNGVASASCITTAAGVGPSIQIGNLHIGQSSSFGINIGSTSTHVTIGKAILNGINGGSAPYIAGPSGWTVDQVRIGQITSTDLAAGGALIGANAQALPSIPSAATLAPLVAYDHQLVTGTTTITNISGNWGDRRLILSFNAALTLTNNANIQLTSGANMVTANGTTIALWYDQANCACWREMWHH